MELQCVTGLTKQGIDLHTRPSDWIACTNVNATSWEPLLTYLRWTATDTVMAQEHKPTDPEIQTTIVPKSV